LLDDAVRQIVAALSPERVYLFGSRARGDATAESDYDLLVVMPGEVAHAHVLEQRALDALRGVPLPVEVVVIGHDRFERYRSVASSLPATVEREGYLLYVA
jgi:predicted nucleotidyltransferase